MSGRFDKLGVQFLYPENWEISEEEHADGPLSVSVQSPGGAFWNLTVYDADCNPDEIAREAVATMRQEYDEVEVLEVEQPLHGELQLAGSELYFYCLDFVINARIFTTRDELDRTFLIFWQAEERDFRELEPVFRALTISLLAPVTGIAE